MYIFHDSVMRVCVHFKVIDLLIIIPLTANQI